ncbi:hypothetical protein ACFE04_009005 [Oxalis oulophora]
MIQGPYNRYAFPYQAIVFAILAKQHKYNFFYNHSDMHIDNVRPWTRGTSGSTNGDLACSGANGGQNSIVPYVVASKSVSIVPPTLGSVDGSDVFMIPTWVIGHLFYCTPLRCPPTRYGVVELNVVPRIENVTWESLRGMKKADGNGQSFVNSRKSSSKKSNVYTEETSLDVAFPSKSEIVQEHGKEDKVLNNVCHNIGVSVVEIKKLYATIGEKWRDKEPQTTPGGISLDKSLSSVLDSFNNVLCRH